MSKEIIKEITKNPKKYANKISIEELSDLLKTLSESYYNSDNPLVNDETYDILYDVLKERDNTNNYFNTVNATLGTKEQVKLPFEMGSLIKIKPSTPDLNKWLNKYHGFYLLSDKLDGVSAQIYKNNIGEIFMYSRGQYGIYGQNISHLLKYVVSKKALKNMQNGTSIRGELIISIENFKQIENTMKNARNAVAGLVNAKHFNIDIAKITDFVSYNILNPRFSYKEQYELLEQYGFKVVVHKQFDIISEEILINYLLERKKYSQYNIDGIVCSDDSKIYSHTGGYPEHVFAFKMLLDEQFTNAKVVKVIWNPSKDGFLKPKIEIEPIELGGTTITYATAFNAKFIVDNNINKGSEIQISRSGDVIPYILQVTKQSKTPQMPDFPYKWNNTHVDLILENETNNNGKEIVEIKLLEHFFSTMKIKYISSGIITKLVENGYKTIFDILKADKNKLSQIDGIGEKLLHKIYEEIDKSFKEVNLETLMGASNKLGRGISEKKISEILNIYPNIILNDGKNTKELYENILKVKGFSEKLSNQFSQNFIYFKQFYNELKTLVDISRFENIQSNKSTNNLFNNKSFVFTGTRNKNTEKFILDNGGKINNTISNNTFMLIYDDNADTTSSKFVNATEKNITKMKMSDFINKYM